MKTLIETNSPLYLKRLVRELNSLTDGFYFTATEKLTSLRSSRARLKAGRLQVKWDRVWLPPLDMNFVDAYGRGIVASRQP